jgi:hypothetical protein
MQHIQIPTSKALLRHLPHPLFQCAPNDGTVGLRNPASCGLLMTSCRPMTPSRQWLLPQHQQSLPQRHGRRCRCQPERKVECESYCCTVWDLLLSILDFVTTACTNVWNKCNLFILARCCLFIYSTSMHDYVNYYNYNHVYLLLFRINLLWKNSYVFNNQKTWL